MFSIIFLGLVWLYVTLILIRSNSIKKHLSEATDKTFELARIAIKNNKPWAWRFQQLYRLNKQIDRDYFKLWKPIGKYFLYNNFLNP